MNYGDHALDLSDCVNLLNLDLTGTRMQALDIRALVQLHNFSIADSQIATLTAANAARYTNAYYWVWDNAKLDLTEETAEGQLMAGLKDYFATTELPDEVGDESVRVGQRLSQLLEQRGNHQPERLLPAGYHCGGQSLFRLGLVR